jgi:hypothetical protein
LATALVAAAAALGLVALGLGVLGRDGHGVGRHPDPRSNATSLPTVNPARYTGYPRINRVYAMAAEAKATLDGIYCYCRCAEHAGHYSLLSCFQSDHGAGCDVCLDQAALAYARAKQGASLDEVRREIDLVFGSGRRG